MSKMIYNKKSNKIIIVFSIIIITLSSCYVTVPLVVNSPAATNTNIVTKQYDFAATAAYLSNYKTRGEDKVTSKALQADCKLAVTKNIFIEAQGIQQNENSQKQGLSNLGRFPDTINAKKSYNRKGYNIGIGYFYKIPSSQTLFLSLSAGYQQNNTNTNTIDITNNSAAVDGFINFKQKGIYINPSLIVCNKQLQYTLGMLQSFIKYTNIISNNIGYN